MCQKDQMILSQILGPNDSGVGRAQNTCVPSFSLPAWSSTAGLGCPSLVGITCTITIFILLATNVE
jgi:hypothetical protein